VFNLRTFLGSLYGVKYSVIHRYGTYKYFNKSAFNISTFETEGTLTAAVGSA